MDPTEDEDKISAALVAESSDTTAVHANSPAQPDVKMETPNAPFDIAEQGVETSKTSVDQIGLIADIWSSASGLIELGGPVVLILIVISIFGFAIALYKFFQFSSLSHGKFKQMHTAVDSWIAGNRDEAKKSLGNVKWSLARTVEFGLQNHGSKNESQLREELSRQGNNFINPYAKYLRPLELIYYLAPVLGLLGTVLGMIEAFKGLEASSGLDKDSTALAGGIWEALLTTAVGLSIAIPFTMIHAWLEARLDAISAMTADLLTRVVTLDANR